MSRFFALLLWTAVFLLMLLAIDQLLTRVPAALPAHVAVADFYRDLRGRVFNLVKGGKSAPGSSPAAPVKSIPPSKAKVKPEAPAAPQSIEAVIKQRQATPAAVDKPAASVPVRPPVNRPVPTEPAPRYVYADSQGELHFAETLAEVPEEYRGKVKRLGE
ncbi:MAG: hypothetical protein FIB02_00040 [Desulfuromonas sp.]|nr:hypothetical protein [Desulfuromonas sp.]